MHFKKIKTCIRLGFSSIIRFFLYFWLKNIGFYRLINPSQNIKEIKLDCINKSKNIFFLYFCSNNYTYFLDQWSRDPVTKKKYSLFLHWSKMSFPCSPGVDIKNIWEPSRFYWYFELCYRSKKDSNLGLKEEAESGFKDWTIDNPAFYGYNWMCGQEAAIRLLNFILGKEIIGDVFSSNELVFVEQHCQRIAMTMYYAKSQKNNHLLSEAIGLYVGSKILGDNKYLIKAKRNLNYCFKKLALKDGTFSQYSVNYQRMAIDLSSIILYFFIKYNDSVNPMWITKIKKMTNWLESFIDPIAQDAANFGNNDGSMLLNTGKINYRDFIHSISIARFCLDIAENKTPFMDMYNILTQPKPVLTEIKSKHFDKGGFIRFKGKNSWAIFNYPKFKFRPHQNDIMHFDLWVKGVNVLLDSGTYSYNASEEFQNYFKSTSAHNTVQIDGLEQMRQISRFLYADWPKEIDLKIIKDLDDNIVFSSCGYRHFTGATHHRSIKVQAGCWIIIDSLKKLKNNATLYWQLPNIKGCLDGSHYQNDLIQLELESDCEKMHVSLDDAWVSKYYQNKEPSLRLSAKVFGLDECQFITTITMKE